jgi:hypothetical protein
MSEPDRIVTREVYWRNAHTSPPRNGRKVRVLNQGGCDAGSATWNDQSIKQFDGWLPFAKVPDDIKQIQLARMSK